MSRQMVFMTFLFIYVSTLAFIMAGEGAFVTAQLSSARDADDTTFPVDSTSGFPVTGVLWVGTEQVSYTGTTATTFTGLTRGIRETTKAGHADDRRVYSESAGIVNQLVGFNILKSLSEDNFAKGIFTMVVSLPGLLINIVTTLAMWDFPMLEGHGAWVKFFFLYPLSVGLIWQLIQLIFRRG